MNSFTKVLQASLGIRNSSVLLVSSATPFAFALYFFFGYKSAHSCVLFAFSFISFIGGVFFFFFFFSLLPVLQ
jgi:hypothetical protein